MRSSALLLRWAPVALLLCAGAATAQPWRPAQAALREAYDAKDWPAMRKAARSLVELRDGAPADLYNLACAEALAGDAAASLGALRELAALGLWFDLSSEPDLASARALPGYAQVQRQLEQNRKPVHRARVVAKLPPGLIAEDVAYDARTRSFLVSSVRQRKVLRVSGGGAITELAPKAGDELLGVFGLALDPLRRALWATVAAVPEAQGLRSEDAGRTALVRLDADTGAVQRGWELPSVGGPHLLGDVALGPRGEVYASDSRGALYRLPPGGDALELLVPKGQLGSPQTVAPTADGKALLVPDYERGIAVLDLQTRALRWLRRPRALALTGIDGLYAVGPALLAVQNGVRPARIVRLWPDAALARIERWEVLESGAEGLGEPTHGTLAGEQFVFIADSGWGSYGEGGASRKGARKDAPALWTLPALPR